MKRNRRRAGRKRRQLLWMLTVGAALLTGCGSPTAQTPSHSSASSPGPETAPSHADTATGAASTPGGAAGSQVAGAHTPAGSASSDRSGPAAVPSQEAAVPSAKLPPPAEAAASSPLPGDAVPTPGAASAAPAPDKASLLRKYAAVKPARWGEHVPGVRSRLQTKEKVIALTFDACGGKEGSGYDRELIEYLIREKIPATLFVNARWIDANPDTFLELARNPLFEIENHGYEHRPLSVNGQSAYGIRGTRSVSEVIDEVQQGADKIEKLTGRRPMLFRSGTAYYDDAAVGILHDLGMQAVNYSVLGDAGATFDKRQVYEAFTKAKNGSIVIGHMNRPDKDTAEGVMEAVPVLKKAGFRFVLLSDYPLE